MTHNEGEKSLAELMSMGVKMIYEGEFHTGQKVDYILPDGTKVEAKIGGLLADGNYLLSYSLDGQELGRKISREELENLDK